ncbi:MAG: T9SS type A sorting domain-containing protein, partial [Bacteroidia bacterium]|nr:T9SS type A sorting domain-containing protein [Bacteroidia bacterium]
NPFSSVARLYIPVEQKLEGVVVEIFSLQGKKVDSFRVPHLLPGSPIRISQNSLAAGMYICKIRTSSTLVATGKFIVN